MYDIVVRFPSKKMADEFCGQMSDGFGESFCDFTPWPENGTEKVKDDAGRPVYFVNWMEQF